MKGDRSGAAYQARKQLVDGRCIAKRAWLQHRKLCHPCRPAQDDPGLWCADGYELARALHIAHKALVVYDSIKAAEQMGLFSIEEVTQNDRTS